MSGFLVKERNLTLFYLRKDGNMKDKSIKSKMKDWIMLSDEELEQSQNYMQEQEENVEDIVEKKEQKEEESRQDSDIKGKKREEEIAKLIEEVGEETVIKEDTGEGTRRRRRTRHKDLKEKENSPVETQEEVLSHQEEEIVGKGETMKKEGEGKSGGNGISKMIIGGVGIVLVLLIAGLGYQTQSLQRQNQRLKTQITRLQKEKKEAQQASKEQALQTKNEDGVIVNTDTMFESIKVGDKEYKLLSKVSDFTKDGWKLEALRNENATLVPGGKLEKDAFLTSTDGKKIGVIIRNMSDKNQKVSNCVITKLSFSKEMFDGQVTLPKDISFTSTEKELKKDGFKKAEDGSYCYISKKVKEDTIRAMMADGENISEITLERAVDETAAATTATTGVTTEAGTDSATTSEKENTAKTKTETTTASESNNTIVTTQKEQ